MRGYCRDLDLVVTTRYKEKLELVGLGETEDPYQLWSLDQFKNDMAIWPPLEYGHILCYFINQPGMFTKTQLVQYKQYGGIQFFSSLVTFEK